MSERRKSFRRRTLLDGRIEVEKLQGWSVGCAVRNVSDAGARIALPARATVPQQFRIAISGGAPRPARLVWYRGGQAGVAFAGPVGTDREWDGVCRRLSRPAVPGVVDEVTALQARIDAIVAGRGAHDRRHRPS